MFPDEILFERGTRGADLCEVVHFKVVNAGKLDLQILYQCEQRLAFQTAASSSGWIAQMKADARLLDEEPKLFRF